MGAAQVVWHEHLNKSRTVNCTDSMQGSYLGPQFNQDEIKQSLAPFGANYKQLDWKELYTTLADILADDKVVGWFQGRMEFGPRALGGRSIIGDPRSEKMQSIFNF